MHSITSTRQWGCSICTRQNGCMTKWIGIQTYGFPSDGHTPQTGLAEDHGDGDRVGGAVHAESVAVDGPRGFNANASHPRLVRHYVASPIARPNPARGGKFK